MTKKQHSNVFTTIIIPRIINCEERKKAKAVVFSLSTEILNRVPPVYFKCKYILRTILSGTTQ